MKKNYMKVRKLSGKRKISIALEIIKKAKSSSENLSKEEEFWFLLVQNEIEIYKNHFRSSLKLLNTAFQISKTINLNPAELSSFYGRLATTQFRSKNYSEAIPFFEKALTLTKDPPRRNYYHSRLLNCYYSLRQEKSFCRTLAITIAEFLQGDIQQYFESIINSIWEISKYGKDDLWYQNISNVIISIQSNNDIKNDQNAILEFIWARLERHRFNKDKFLIHMKRSLEFSKNVNPDFFVSMSFNYITILENPFSEHHRAITLLKECLKITTNKVSRKVHILNKLGSNFRFIGDFKKAIKCLEDALEINDSLYPWLEAFTHNTLGMIYTSIGDYEAVQKALTHYTSSLEISKKNNDPYGMGYTFGALGWLESNHSLDKAKEWYELSISTFEECTNSVPPIILLALAEVLSRTDDKNTEKIDRLIFQARKQIWIAKKKLDIGRYYNTLGNIALNRKQLQEAERAFSEALDYGDYFEVEAHTLLGLTKVNLELFVIHDNQNYLRKAKLLLNDLKGAIKSSFLILGEVDLILGLIEMYNRRYNEANQILSHVIQFAQKNNYLTHSKLQKITTPSIGDNVKTNQIKDAIIYLNELSRFLGPQTGKKNVK
ncbi:MAG: hypothetical protein ACW964_06700 [Candidatus Hodarchaeales archaeon]|jgi:tetratricopeptide (TPR) repeat protein